jgi:putative ABC transport system permease protein
MIRNFIITALRNISRNKFYALLNILGLSVGIAAFIFILLFIRDELTYDRYNTRHERIYRIASDFNISNKHDKFAIVPVPMGPAFKLEFPEVESFVRLTDVGNVLIRYKDIENYEEDFGFADSTLFDIFDFEFILGSPEKALTEPFTIVITDKIAEKYFGDANPIGEMITTGSGRSYKVTAVVQELPRNTHLSFDAYLSVTSLQEIYGADNFNSLEPVRFWNIGVYTYLLLHENASMSTIMEKFPAFYEKYMKAIGDQVNASFDLLYTPLAETHFSTGLGSDQPTGNMAYIYIFSAVAAFILLLAVINYMNMATARSSKRAREVGMRKVVGANRGQLIWQFLAESLLMAVFAMVIAIILVILLLPDFNTLSGKMMAISRLGDVDIILISLGIVLLVGVVSGSYPAFFLSRFRPITVLKGRSGGTGRKSGNMRRTLVIIQFFIAIVMIIGTMVVSSQISYLQEKDLGFDKDNLVVLELQDSTFRSKVETFKKELLQDPDITGATNSTGVPGRINWIQVIRVEREDEMADNAMILAQVDHDYLDVMGMEIVKGRNFDRKMGTDQTEAVIINETGVKALGWEDDPIGKKIQYGFDLEGDEGRIMKVIGVVKDFHFRSLHNKVEPVILFISEEPRYYLSLRVKNGKVKDAISYIEDKWNSFGAGRPFEYNMLTGIMDDMYEAEKKLSTLFRIATGLTIFIALLGLLGLSSFIAEQRTKEIGIRKVVGASVTNIMVLLSKEFLLLILVGFVLAVPIAWWRLDIWLKESFVYYTDIGWMTFVYAGLLAFAIGMVTISYHILRVATGNPVDAIKYE